MRLIRPFVNVLILAIVGVVPLLVGLDVQGQEIPRDKYLQYLPLKSPAIVRQTEASDELHLFGNTEDSEYKDIDPVDGIDDRRHKVLPRPRRAVCPVSCAQFYHDPDGLPPIHGARRSVFVVC